MTSANEPLPPEPMPQPTTPAERAALRRARGRRRRLLWIATVGGWIAAVLVACTIFSLLLQRTHQANANLPREYRNALTTAAPGWAEDGLNCTLRDGAYHVTPTSANTAVTCYAPAGDFGDFNLQVQASLAAGRDDIGYGLAFREGDADEYVFEITDNGRADVEIARFGQISVLSDVWTLPAAARGAGHTHTLRVEARGDTFTCFVDGTRLGSVTDGHFPLGRVGLFAGMPGQDAAFTDFDVITV